MTYALNVFAARAAENIDALQDAESFADLGFVVDAEVDEVNVVRAVWGRGKAKGGEALLTILPTLGCNFGCPYCFERHIKGLMSTTVQDALFRFVEERLLPATHQLSIEWFGGEPLLGIEVIESLTYRFRELCAAYELEPPAGSITTNGYLLTPAMCSRLMSLGVTSAQVTLDGPPAIHDRRRPLAGGGSTFARVLSNLKQVPSDFGVTVRINVDAGNCDSVFELLQLLHEEGVLSRASAYLAKVESFSEECRSSQGTFLDSAEYARFKSETARRCREAGIPWTSDDVPRLVAYGYCIVDQPKGFVVQPDGALLKCWAEAGNSIGRPVAHLLQPETWGTLNVSPLQTRDPFDDAECCECALLPVCMGGCPRIRETLRRQAIKRCPPLRYSLRDEVRMLYERRLVPAAQQLPLRLSI